MAEAAPVYEWFRAVWGHADARRHLWQSEAKREAFVFRDNLLKAAASFVTAEFEVLHLRRELCVGPAFFRFRR